MNLRSIALSAALLALAVFAVLNWSAFLATTTLSLGLAEVQAPLGLIMLAVTAAVSGLFLVYILFQQATVILETRRAAKQLHAQRELADRAEASRFTELRGAIEADMRRLEAQVTAAVRELREHVDGVGQQLGGRMDESTRSLSAYVGEVEDKLDRLLQTRGPNPIAGAGDPP